MSVYQYTTESTRRAARETIIRASPRDSWDSNSRFEATNQSQGRVACVVMTLAKLLEQILEEARCNPQSSWYAGTSMGMKSANKEMLKPTINKAEDDRHKTQKTNSTHKPKTLFAYQQP